MRALRPYYIWQVQVDKDKHKTLAGHNPRLARQQTTQTNKHRLVSVDSTAVANILPANFFLFGGKIRLWDCISKPHLVRRISALTSTSIITDVWWVQESVYDCLCSLSKTTRTAALLACQRQIQGKATSSFTSCITVRANVKPCNVDITNARKG